MPPVGNTEWLERLRQLHPLLEAPPPVSEWAARQAEIDAASKVDGEAARRSRDATLRQRERQYDNHVTTWAGIVIVALVALLGVFITFCLIEKGRLEDCLLAHRSNCDSLLQR
jgi:hypothetical protein